jgi:hypothetical protein
MSTLPNGNPFGVHRFHSRYVVYSIRNAVNRARCFSLCALRKCCQKGSFIDLYDESAREHKKNSYRAKDRPRTQGFPSKAQVLYRRAFTPHRHYGGKIGAL